MERAVTYSVAQRVDPREPEVAGKFYATAQARGVMGIREMAERIQQACTVTRADTMAVLTALEDVVSDGLQGGEIIRLGELGSLQISLSGKGAVSAEEYHDSLITKARILFRPGTTLKNAISNLSFQRVNVKTTKTDEEEETGGAGV